MIPRVTLDPSIADAWRPGLPSHGSSDIMCWYDAVARHLPRDAVCVEVGVAHGRTVLWLAELLVTLGKDLARIYAVDPWRGAAAADDRAGFPHPLASVYRAWVGYASDQELQHVYPLRLPSMQAVRLFEASSIDMVMLDAAHDGRSAAEDITAWESRLRPGGWLCGHDYSSAWPGVVGAVDRLLGSRAVVCGTVWIAEVQRPGPR